MSRKEKLIKKLLKKPKDYSYQELTCLLNYFGYTELKHGKTSGSRRAFYNVSSKHVIRLHKPHPKEILKLYQIDMLIEELKKEGLL
jgi:hypothetical protein